MQEILGLVRRCVTDYDMIQEGLTAKLVQLPEEVRVKFRGSLARVVNEGATGMICIIF